jgi:hypothetical protein
MVKTNLLHAAALAPNLEVEAWTGKRTSVTLSGSWKAAREGRGGWIASTGVRFWSRYQAGHFTGIHAFAGQYDVAGLSSVLLAFHRASRYAGHVVGTGISYGYAWWPHPSWGMEFNAGIGAAFTRYRHGKGVSTPRASDKHFYFGPTSLGVKLVYRIKTDEK